MATHKLSAASGSQGFSVSILPKELGIALGWGRGLAPLTVAAARRLEVGLLTQYLVTEPALSAGISPSGGLVCLASWALGQFLASNLESPGPI